MEKLWRTASLIRSGTTAETPHRRRCASRSSGGIAPRALRPPPSRPPLRRALPLLPTTRVAAAKRTSATGTTLPAAASTAIAGTQRNTAPASTAIPTGDFTAGTPRIGSPSPRSPILSYPPLPRPLACPLPRLLVHRPNRRQIRQRHIPQVTLRVARHHHQRADLPADQLRHRRSGRVLVRPPTKGKAGSRRKLLNRLLVQRVNLPYRQRAGQRPGRQYHQRADLPVDQPRHPPSPTTRDAAARRTSVTGTTLLAAVSTATAGTQRNTVPGTTAFPRRDFTAGTLRIANPSPRSPILSYLLLPCPLVCPLSIPLPRPLVGLLVHQPHRRQIRQRQVPQVTLHVARHHHQRAGLPVDQLRHPRSGRVLGQPPTKGMAGSRRKLLLDKQ
mmetsp:Transcript_55226/g.165475  ORF Transcript_55226/g.165475 Transcript_55226/m.165475 type:complete len:387 (+) Transcript_55226:384-1544(+)